MSIASGSELIQPTNERINPILLPSQVMERGVKIKFIQPELQAALQNGIFLSKEECRQYNLEVGQNITFRFGHTSKTIIVSETPSGQIPIKKTLGIEGTELHLSKQVIEELGIPDNIPLRLRYDDEKKEMRVGPIIAIMSGMHEGSKILFPQHDLFKKLASFGNERGALVCVIHPSMVDEKKGTMIAYIPSSGPSINWRRVVLPLPDVVYDRSFFQKGPELVRGDELRSFFDIDSETHLINSESIRILAKDKLAFAQSLLADERLCSFVPETQQMQSGEDIDYFLTKYGKTIIKLRDGGAARGIFLVDKQHDGSIQLSYTDRGEYKTTGRLKHIVKSYKNSNELVQEIHTLHPDGDFIVQERKELMSYHGAPFEFRVAFQKGEHRKWTLLQITARINNPHAIVGGLGESFVPGLPVIQELFGEASDEKLRNLVYRARDALIRMENVTGGNAADMVVDFSYTKDGEPFIIEANSKQSHFWKNSDEASTSFIQRHTNIIEYAASVVGLSQLEPLMKNSRLMESPIKVETARPIAQKGRLLKIEPLAKNSDRIFLSETERKRLGVNFGDTIVICFGTREHKVKVAYSKLSHQSETDSWRVSENVFHHMNIPVQTHLLERWNKEKKVLQLGPLIGMLARADIQNGVLSQVPFGDSTEELYDIIRHSSMYGGSMFVFSPESVDTTSSTIKGYIPDSITETDWRKVTWHTVEMPLPDVYWARHFSKNDAQKISATKVKSYLRAQGIPSVNTTEFSNLIGTKTKFQEFLLKDSELRKYSPETIVMEGPQSVEEIFRRGYDSVYVKPVFGTKGQGIVKVEKRGNDYICSFKDGDDSRNIRGSDLHDVLRRAGVTYEKRSYLCQQGLHLARFDGKIFDIRALTQKIENGWDVTGMAARVSSDVKSIVSNLHAGGKALQVRQVLSRLFSPEIVLKIENEIISASILLATRLDEITGGKASETGIDIGVDVDGRVWFIEANPIPGRGIFLDTKEETKRREACSRPIRSIAKREGFL